MKEIIRKNIDEHGQHLFHIFPTGDDEGDAFTYTVGNKERGLPDLLLLGNYGPVGGAILNHVADALVRHGLDGIENGFLETVLQKPVKLRVCGPAAKADFTFQASRFYCTTDYDLMQVLLWDKEGRYTDDPSCDPAYACPLV